MVLKRLPIDGNIIYRYEVLIKIEYHSDFHRLVGVGGNDRVWGAISMPANVQRSSSCGSMIHG